MERGHDDRRLVHIFESALPREAILRLLTEQIQEDRSLGDYRGDVYDQFVFGPYCNAIFRVLDRLKRDGRLRSAPGSRPFDTDFLWAWRWLRGMQPPYDNLDVLKILAEAFEPMLSIPFFAARRRLLDGGQDLVEAAAGVHGTVLDRIAAGSIDWFETEPQRCDRTGRMLRLRFSRWRPTIGIEVGRCIVDPLPAVPRVGRTGRDASGARTGSS